MKFEPAPDYENLLRQARALACIVDSKEKQCSLYEKNVRELRKQLAEIGPAAINAERETNRILTERLEQLESRLERMNASEGLC